MKNNKNKKGFTIVELVIVIAVIAILAAVLIPTFSGVVEKANQSKALQEAKNALTDDLVKLDADVNNYFIITEDTELNEGTTYYTVDANGVYSAVESPNVANIGTYYEANTECEGSFNNITDNGYTYTFESSNGDYTATYTSGGWDVDKNI